MEKNDRSFFLFHLVCLANKKVFIFCFFNKKSLKIVKEFENFWSSAVHLLIAWIHELIDFKCLTQKKKRQKTVFVPVLKKSSEIL